MDKYLIIDTETANGLDDPLTYDIGCAIIDKNGFVYDTLSFVITDIFLKEEFMSTAYYKEKKPLYWEKIKSGEAVLTSFYRAKKLIHAIMAQYNVSVVIAHNVRFDYRSTNVTQRYLTKSKYRYFFPYGTKFLDTLSMARAVLKESQQYREFCLKNDFITQRGVNRYTAEILYRFITDNVEFVEKHTGLEDVLIEKDIFKYCVEKKPELLEMYWWV